MKNYIIKTICWTLIISYFAGCTTTEVVTYKTQLNDPGKTGTLNITTKDSIEYVLDKYYLKDSLITGSGLIITKGVEKPFNGTININNVIRAKGDKTSIGIALLGLGVAGLFLIAYLANTGVEDSGNKIDIYFTGSGGGCK